MNSSVKLKIKNDSNFALINLYSNSTIKELILAISKVIDIGDEEMNLLVGYPPKPLTMDMDLTLNEAKIISGDCIILKKLKNPEVKRLKLDTINNEIEGQKSETPKTNLGSESDILMSLIECQKSISPKILTKQTIPSDNSCLFASVYFCLNNATLNGFDSENERQLICAMLLSQPDKFDSAFLENKTPEMYCEWIMDINRWGGSIELHLMSCLYQVEINVVNIQSDRIDRFGEDQNYSEKILILYDGIHYDSLATEDVNTGKLVSKYSIADNEVMEQARQLSRELKSSKQYTNTQQFRIVCNDCNTVLVGEKALATHAAATGHRRFGEIDSN